METNLKQLQDQLLRKAKIIKLLEDLEYQKKRYAYAAEKSLEILKSEQEDVSKLEKKTLTALFYEWRGTHDEKLEKEKAEELQARLKYEADMHQLDKIKEEIEVLKLELDSLANCEQEYEKAYAQKLDEIKNSHSPSGIALLGKEAKMTSLENQMKELEEAISAGEAVSSSIQEIADSFNSARTWGTFDMLGGGLFSTAMKHSHISDAQLKLEYLQQQLSRFHAELKDVKFHHHSMIDIGSFLSFSDFIFDNFFIDLLVQSKINQALQEVEKVYRQIQDILSSLHTDIKETKDEIKKVQAEIDHIINNS